MHLNAYQCLASRTIDRKRSTQETLTHSLLGLCAETGELLARYQKHLQGILAWRIPRTEEPGRHLNS